MLPPSRTGAAPAPRTAAQRALVVVLPFVPVTPTVGHGHSRRKRSISLSTGVAARGFHGAEGGAQPRLGRVEPAADRR